MFQNVIESGFSMEYVALVLSLTFTVVVLGILLNPDFWQGYRNSKFIDSLYDDELDETDTKEIINE